MAIPAWLRVGGEFISGGVPGVLMMEGPRLIHKYCTDETEENADYTEVIAEDETEEN